MNHTVIEIYSTQKHTQPLSPSPCFTMYKANTVYLHFMSATEGR